MCCILSWEEAQSLIYELCPTDSSLCFMFLLGLCKIQNLNLIGHTPQKPELEFELIVPNFGKKCKLFSKNKLN